MAAMNGDSHTSSAQLEPPSIKSEEGYPNLPAFLKLNKDTLPSLTELNDFLATNTEVEIDGVNQRGETALMIACHAANKDVARYLLGKGADPNLAAHNGYTPLYFAALYSNDMSVPDNEKSIEAEDRKCLEVMQLLHDEFGATIQPDKYGVNPVEMAAGGAKMITVEHCIAQRWISEIEQIKALEILGMGLATYRRFTEAYAALWKAKTMRHECGHPPGDHKSVLECCFGRSETKTLHDLRKLETCKEEIVAEGFLVADRVLPDQFKLDKWYYTVIRYAADLIDRRTQDYAEHRKPVSRAFAVFSGLLPLEKTGCTFGYILRVCSNICCNVVENSLFYRGRITQRLISRVGELLKAYVEVAREVEASKMKKSVRRVVKDLALILFYMTEDCFSVLTVGSYVNSIASLLSVIWSKIPKSEVPESTFDMFTKESVCHKVLCMAGDEDSKFNRYLWVAPEHDECFKRLIAQLLQIEGASSVDEDGNTMLHSLFKQINPEEMSFVMALAQLLVRHGCPREVKNKKGETPLDMLKDEDNEYSVGLDEYDASTFDDLCKLMKGPTDVYSLEELAARTVLRHRMPYDHMLPDMLKDIFMDRILLEDQSRFQTPDYVSSDSTDDCDTMWYLGSDSSNELSWW